VNRSLFLWIARLIVGVVFFFNVTCALEFIARPGDYAPGFELSGLPGEAMVRGIGILFLMWNATYPPVLVRPDRERTLFAVVLAQQAIGVLGETASGWACRPGIRPSGRPACASSCLTARGWSGWRWHTD
jgi:hypothetical protein